MVGLLLYKTTESGNHFYVPEYLKRFRKKINARLMSRIVEDEDFRVDCCSSVWKHFLCSNLIV